MATKDEVRAYLLGVCADIPEAEQQMRSGLCSQMVLSVFGANKISVGFTVALYRAMRNELNPAVLEQTLRDKGARVVFPCTRSDASMDFFEIAPEALEAGDVPAFVSAPGRFCDDSFDGDARCTYVAPEQIDAIIVPGVGFAATGKRLGRGKGCYDRYLPQLRDDCLSIGVGFDAQMMDDLPFESHDFKLNYVVSPSRIWNCK